VTGPLALGVGNPLDLRGPEFLGLYVVFLGGALLLAFVVRALATPKGDDAAARPWASRATADELAFLSHGKDGLLEAAVATLAVSGRAVQDAGQRGLCRAGQTTAFDGSPAVQAVFRALPGPGDFASRRELARALEPVAAPIERRLVQAGLAIEPGTALRIALLSTVPLWLVAGLGIAKILVGISRDRPVAFLVVLVLATVFAAVLAAVRRPIATETGESLLEHLRAKQARLLEACAWPQRLDPEQVALAVALFGATALSSFAITLPAVADLQLFLAGATRRGTSTEWGSSGCGGGGGGCGGGGGGCGGCGG
jgi:uncharacterized protein (TIGR04222 family)